MIDSDQITTWVGVAGTAITGVVAAITAYLRIRAKERIAAIDKGTSAAAQIVANAVTSYKLNTDRLSRDQVFQLVRDEVAARDKRHARSMVVSLGLALIFAVATVTLAIMAQWSSSTGDVDEEPNVSTGVDANVTVLNTSVDLDVSTLDPTTMRLRQALPILEPPILDIKVVNQSNMTQYLSELRIIAVRDFYEGPSEVCMGINARPSGFYDVSLDLNRRVQFYILPISQALKPGEVDRFLVSITPAPKHMGRAEFQIAGDLRGLGGFQIRLQPVKIGLELVPGSCNGVPIRRPWPRISARP